MATEHAQACSSRILRAKSARNTVVAFSGLVLLAGLGYVGFSVRVRTTAEETVLHAQRLLLDRKPAEARTALERLLWFDPAHAEALLIVGKSFRAERKLPAAAEAFSRVPAESRKHRQAGLLQVKVLLQDARFEEAEGVLEDYLQRYPNSRPAAEELKWLYFNQLRRREVEDFLEARLARQPEDFSLLNDLLNTEFRRQTAEEIIGNLKRIDAHQPGQPPIILALGYCHWQLGELEDAWQHLERALELRPDYDQTRLKVARFLLEQAEIEAASELFKNPTGSTASRDDRWLWLQSRLARMRGDRKKALERAEQALEQRPFELKYVQGYAGLLQEHGMTDQAAAAFEKAGMLERCRSRLEEIVLSGVLAQPTPELCREVADLCEQRGRAAQASGWRAIARQLERN